MGIGIAVLVLYVVYLVVRLRRSPPVPLTRARSAVSGFRLAATGRAR
ncbi:hypothetical protein ACIGEZ_07370 [Streptomyces sp. NPDC085481]